MASTYVWQGFRHEWLREVLGVRLPHRISRLHSHIAPDGRFSFAQSTGVDGNYMRPVGLWARVEAPDLHVDHADVQLTWRDAIETRGVVPLATSSRSETVRFELPPQQGIERVEALLRGVRLDTRCCDAHQPDGQPCNSNGFWPVSLQVRLGEVRLAPGYAEVDVETQVVRGWTPTRGGIPVLEEKPLNAALDYDLEVGVTLVGSTADGLAATRVRTETEGSARLRDGRRASRRVRVRDEAPVVVGITGFGFEFVKTGRTRFHEHRGRYLSALDFRAGDVTRSPGIAELETRTGVWIPRTVVGTDVRAFLETSVLQPLHADARVARGSVAGSLCIHSSDQAPFFSWWRPKAGRYGAVQSADARVLPSSLPAR